MSRRMLLVLSLLAVLSLGAMGMAYTLWSDTLEINGTVTTGVVDARMSLHQIVEVVNVNGTEQPESNYPEKAAAAQCTAQLIDGPLGSAPGDVDTGPDKVEVTITGAYPGYICYVYVDVVNIGNVPVKLTDIGVTSGAEGSPGNPMPNVSLSVSGCWSYNYQLEQGESTFTQFPECRVRIDTLQAAHENTPYTFLGTFQARQWNEAGTP